ncbi:hypothetical protein LNTAR_21195 [Lentisphaera araneosa HTCC2155]|uniref:HTH cro/C1-type domain-containing protein n=1 Tax=Lentisphaera araneosa HTCC2155 TaxID=313628 RepID=A6DLX3_9BACT|nr:helix-turn-helix transcriptional regulator [Lentisphaera araneosa]EDM27271.1 hypothetical protein LNTAR_21195 [Lentisphaera araneosa HTCC2155]
MKDIQKVLQDIDAFKSLVLELHERKKREEAIELEQVGPFIKGFRKDRGITQNDFALALGLSKNVIAAIEAGHLTVKLENFLKVTHAVGLKVFFNE